MDIEGFVLVLLIWVGGIDRPFEYVMPGESIEHCITLGRALAPDIAKEMEADVIAACELRRTVIVRDESAIKRHG